MNKKERYYNTNNKNYYSDTPGFWQYEEKSNIIEQETNLISPSIGTRQKHKLNYLNIFIRIIIQYQLKINYKRN